MKKDFKNWGLFRIFISYFKPHMGLFALDMVCALFISLVDLLFPYASRLCLYELIPGHLYGAFFAVIGIIVAAYLIRALLQYVVVYWGHAFGILVEADIREDLFTHLQTLPVSFFDKNRTGHLMSQLTSELFDITELAHHGPEDVFISTVTVAGAIAILFTIQWRLALLMLVLIPIFLAVATLNRKRMRDTSRAVKRVTASINADIESSLSGMRTAKAFANETAEHSRFDAANDRFRGSKKAQYKAMGVFQSSLEFFTSIMPVAVIAYGGYLIMKGLMDYRDLITFTLYTSTFVAPIRKLANLSEMLVNGMAGLSRFTDLMRVEPELSDKPDAVDLRDVRGRIDVNDVSFSYERDETPVLRHVDLHVSPGETVAVVGPSGGGKTTLCSLIPRFYDVTAGSILVDGTDVRDVTQKSLRRNIGVVQQDVFLFADSIMNNIRYGRPDASDSEVAEAAKRAEIYDDIMAMPAVEEPAGDVPAPTEEDPVAMVSLYDGAPAGDNAVSVQGYDSLSEAWYAACAVNEGGTACIELLKDCGSGAYNTLRLEKNVEIYIYAAEPVTVTVPATSTLWNGAPYEGIIITDGTVHFGANPEGTAAGGFAISGDVTVMGTADTHGTLTCGSNVAIYGVLTATEYDIRIGQGVVTLSGGTYSKLHMDNASVSMLDMLAAGRCFANGDNSYKVASYDANRARELYNVKVLMDPKVKPPEGNTGIKYNSTEPVDLVTEGEESRPASMRTSMGPPLSPANPPPGRTRHQT